MPEKLVVPQLSARDRERVGGKASLDLCPVWPQRFALGILSPWKRSGPLGCGPYAGCAGNADHSWGMPVTRAKWHYQKVREEEQCGQKVSDRRRTWPQADF